MLERFVRVKNKANSFSVNGRQMAALIVGSMVATVAITSAIMNECSIEVEKPTDSTTPTPSGATVNPNPTESTWVVN